MVHNRSARYIFLTLLHRGQNEILKNTLKFKNLKLFILMKMGPYIDNVRVYTLLKTQGYSKLVFFNNN